VQPTNDLSSQRLHANSSSRALPLRGEKGHRQGEARRGEARRHFTTLSVKAQGPGLRAGRPLSRKIGIKVGTPDIRCRTAIIQVRRWSYAAPAGLMSSG
jgi:hypothetical protein